MRKLRLAIAALVALSSPALMAQGARAAVTTTVSAEGGYEHTFFTPPNDVSVRFDGGSATADLTEGTPVRLHAGTLQLAFGTNPGGPTGCSAPGDSASDTMDVEVTAAGSTLTFRYGLRTRWVCHGQGDFDITLPPGQTIDLPDGDTLTITPYNADPYAAYHPNVESGQFPSGYHGGALLQFTVLLSGPADTTPPQVTPTVTGPLGADGWYTGDTDLTWAVTDPDSSIDARTGCLDQHITADQPKTAYSCTATSAGGTTGPISVTIGRDATPPTIDVTLEPASPDGADGWYVSTPTADARCTDATSGVADCTAPTIPEGISTPTATATDNAGNRTAKSLGELKVDLHDPTVQCRPGPAFALGEPGARVEATVADSGSGPAASTVSAAADTSSVGTHTVAVTGRDRAGRATTVACRYSVAYVWQGFFQPVRDGLNTANAGQAIPLKWRVVDYAGNPVTTLSDVSLSVADQACAAGSTSDRAEEQAAGGSGLRNLGDGYYQLNWKTPRSYASSCKTLRLDLGDGVVHTAAFAFR